MRSNLPQCARLVALASLVTACSSRNPASTAARQEHVVVTATCSGNQISLGVNPSTVQFHHTGPGQQPTNVDWTLQSSSVTDVTIAPDAPGQWPFDGTPPFHATTGKPYAGTGKSNQAAGHYRYSVTVTCNGTTAIFDPDIWVD